MPTSQFGQISKVVKLIFLINPDSILDIGVGFGKYGFLAREYLEFYRGSEDYHNFKHKIDGVEIFKDYLTPVHSYIYNNIFIGDACQVLSDLKNNYDLVLLIDILEHFEKKLGEELINQILKKNKILLISTPKYDIEQQGVFNNPNEAHKAFWRKGDFKKIASCFFIYDKESHLVLLGDSDKINSFRTKYYIDFIKSFSLHFPLTIPIYKRFKKFLPKIKLAFFNIFKKICVLFSGIGLGKAQIVESIYIYFFRTLAPRGEILLDILGNKMYVNTNDVGVAPSLLTKGVYEKYQTEIFNQLVNPGMVVVDVGANIGYYTLIAAKNVGQKGFVYAFEPERNNYQILNKNIGVNNFDNVLTIAKALSNEEKKVNLYRDKNNYGLPSLANENTFTPDNYQEIESISLDDYFNKTVKNLKVDLIKIDAQGAEKLVMEGAKEIIEKNNLKIIMEFWPFGLKNLGTDPLELIEILINKFRFEIKIINEEKKCLEKFNREKIVKFCEGLHPKKEMNFLLEKAK